MTKGIEPGVLYMLVDDHYTEPVRFGATPDGIGMHWYDTREEAIADRLDFPEKPTEVELTQDELDELREE